MTAIGYRLTESASSSSSGFADGRVLTRHSPSSLPLQSLLQRNGRLTPPARGHDRMGIILGDPARIRQECPLALRNIGRLDRYPVSSLGAACARPCPR